MASRGTVKLLAVVAATLAWICEAPAQTSVDLAADPVTPIAPKLGVDALRYEIRLRNPSDQRKIVRTGLFLTRSEDGLTAQASFDPPDGAVQPKGDLPIAVPAKGDLSLTLSASLPMPGAYETWIEIADEKNPEKTEKRIPITVTRAIEPVTPTLLAGAKPQQLVWWPWGNGLLTGPSTARSTLLPVTNAGTKPIAFDPPVILGVHKLEGEAELSAFSTEAMRLTAAGCPTPLPAGRSCVLDLTTSQTLSPGSYLVEYGTGGPGGGWSKGELKISVRASALIAFVLVFAGVWAGAYVDGWRKGGRAALDALILLKKASARLAALKGSRDLEPWRAALVQDIEALESQVDAGQPDQAANTAVLGRVQRFCNAWNLSIAFQGLKPPGIAVIGPRYRAVQDILLSKDATAEQLKSANGMAQALSGDLAAWPRAAAALRRTTDVPAALDRLLGAMGQDRPKDNTLPTPTLKETRADLVKVLPAGTDETIETRLAQVDAAESAIGTVVTASSETLWNRCASLGPSGRSVLDDVADWRKTPKPPFDPGQISRLADLWAAYRTLSAAKQSTAEQPVPTESLQVPESAPAAPKTAPPPMAPAAPASPSTAQEEKPQIAVVFGSSSMTLAELQAARKKAERASNLIIATSMALASIVVLANSPTWGSWTDLVAAFMAGVGSRIVFTALTYRPQG